MVDSKPVPMSSNTKIIKQAKTIKGIFTPPPDKSITHRALIISALAKGKSAIVNPLYAADTMSTLNCLKALGVNIEKQSENGELPVEGNGLWSLKCPPHELDCGNSGTTMRLLSGVLAAQNFMSSLAGDESLSQRPMKRVIHPLTLMGAEIKARDNNFAPLRIKGRKPLLSLPGYTLSQASAQVKSCILLAGLHAQSGTTRITEPVKSRDHTERMLKAAGAKILERANVVDITPDGQIQPMKWVVPGDFSSAAFFLVAAALLPGSDLRVINTGVNPTRTGLFRILKDMAAGISLENAAAGCEPISDLHCQYSELVCPGGLVEIGPEMIPLLIDEIPCLAVAATQAKGETRIRGAEELRVKESDRLAAIAGELNKMGARIEEKPDGLNIYGPARLAGAVVNSHKDHRIAMALAVAGLLAQGETVIEDSDCVDISFPDFWKTLNGLAHY